MDYATKIALNQYPHEDKLYVFGQDTLSESELFGEASRIMDGLDTNIMIHIEESQTNAIRKSRSRETEQEEQEESNHVQKRYRTITRVA
jgi:hypothetical protein